MTKNQKTETAPLSKIKVEDSMPKQKVAVEEKSSEQPKVAEEQSETVEDVKAVETLVSQSEIDSVIEKQPKPKTVSKPQTLAIVQCLPNQQWQASYEAVVGLAHRDANPPLPCQDSAMALTTPRPMVIVADGAGSSAVSEIGALAVTTGLTRLLNTLEKQVAQLLDTNQATDEAELRSFGLMLVKHAKGILDDLAVQHRRPLKDFRSTLLLAIQGKTQLFWVKIGDGALVTETLTEKKGQLLPSLQTLGKVGKGEFANATTFIDDHLQPSDVQTGGCASEFITGFAAMSDGAADRLVANDASRVSPQISDWFNKLRQEKLKRRELTRLFSSENFTKGTTGDDASIALCSSGLKEPTTKEKG